MPTFSSISITFLEPFEPPAVIFNTITINTFNSLTNLFSQIRERIVLIRTDAGTFSVGANATEQAQFYKDALDLDIVPSGNWEVTILGNTVTIASTLEEVSISAVLIGQPNNTRATVSIDNFTNEIPRSTGILPARSNYYINRLIADPLISRQTVKMWFNSGAFNDDYQQDAPDLEATQLRPSIDWSDFDFSISEYARTYLNPSLPTFTEGLVTSPSGNVITTSVSTRSNLDGLDQPILNQMITTLGYATYQQGAQPSYVRDILLSSTVNQVKRDSLIVVPVNTTLTAKSIVLSNEAGTPIALVNTPVSNQVSGAISYVVFSTEGLTDQFVTVTGGYTFEIIDECINPTETVYFLNRYGVFEGLTFFKERVNSMEVERFGAFKNNYVNGGVFDTKRHLYRSGESNGRESFRLTSGYVSELQNNAFEDLLLSDYVFLASGQPLNVDTTNFEKKTRVVDKLISYEINFKLSEDKVQVV